MHMPNQLCLWLLNLPRKVRCKMILSVKPDRNRGLSSQFPTVCAKLDLFFFCFVVKDRRVILTRSKSKDDEVEEAPLKKNSKRPKTAVESTQDLNRRNAPSPDIIDGVMHKQQGGGKRSSTSESESTSSSGTKFLLLNLT